MEKIKEMIPEEKEENLVIDGDFNLKKRHKQEIKAQSNKRRRKEMS